MIEEKRNISILVLVREVHCPHIWEHGLPRDIWHYFTQALSLGANEKFIQVLRKKNISAVSFLFSENALKYFSVRERRMSAEEALLFETLTHETRKRTMKKSQYFSLLVKTINQFGRHIPSAGGHEGGEAGPGWWEAPTPFPDGCVGLAPEASPVLSKKARPSPGSASVLLLEKERVATLHSGPGWQQLGLVSPTLRSRLIPRRVCTSAAHPAPAERERAET